MGRWIETALTIVVLAIPFACCGFAAGLWTRDLITAGLIGLIVGLSFIVGFFGFDEGLLFFLPVAIGASVAGCFLWQKMSRQYLFVLRISALLIAVFVLALPAFLQQGHGESGGRAVCLSNLKQIGLALAMYADANQGQLPPKSGAEGLGYLYPKYVPSLWLFRCREDKARHEPVYDKPLDEDHCSYTYVGGVWQSKDNTNAVPICWDKDGNHRGRGLNVLFSDIHVQWMSLEQWQKIKPAE